VIGSVKILLLTGLRYIFELFIFGETAASAKLQIYLNS